MRKEEFEIELNEQHIAQIEIMLKTLYKKAPNAARSAVNSTMTEAKKLLQKHVKDNYNLPPKTVNDSFSQKRASQSDLQALIRAKGEPLEYKEFKHTNIGSRGVEVKVMKNGSTNASPKLFWADLPAGSNKHRAIMQRLTGEEYEKDPWKTFRITRKLDTTKIDKKYGPAIPTTLWKEGGIYDQVKGQILTMLQNHIDNAVEKLLDKNK